MITAFLLLIGVIAVIMSLFEEAPYLAAALVIFFVGYLFYKAANASMERKLKEDEIQSEKTRLTEYISTHHDDIEKCTNKYDQFLADVYNHYGKPYKYLHVDDFDEVKEGEPKSIEEKKNKGRDFYICFNGDTLSFIWVPSKEKYEYFAEEEFSSYDPVEILIKSIPKENIVYFSREGMKQYSTSVYGGGGNGGGSSLAGAVVGGLLAGPAGAVIGSRKPIYIDPIVSATNVHDDRITVLKTETEEMHFALSVYSLFMEFFPEKEYTYIQAKTNRAVKDTIENVEVAKIENQKEKKYIAETSSKEARLIELKNLFDKELITKDEYDSARKKVLDE